MELDCNYNKLNRFLVLYYLIVLTSVICLIPQSSEFTTKKSKNITCYCESCKDYSCTTNLKCYASFHVKSLKNKILGAKRGCINENSKNPFMDECSFKVNGVETIKCCEKDNCNDPYSIQVPSYTEQEMVIMNKLSNDMFENIKPAIEPKITNVWILCGACVIVTLLIAILITVKVVKYNKKAKKATAKTSLNNHLPFESIHFLPINLSTFTCRLKNLFKNILWIYGCRINSNIDNDDLSDETNNNNLNNQYTEKYNNHNVFVDNKGSNNQKTNKENPNDLSYSGSGAKGSAILEQSSIAYQLTLHEQIGRGRFGTVFRASLHGQDVAVKIPSPMEDNSGIYEASVYFCMNIRHENILCFKALDVKDLSLWNQTVLVFEYHKNGSLFDYLKYVELSETDALKIAISAANGLNYLHCEIVDQWSKKPPLAHRDIKSKNILVKRDGNCCISDLGSVYVITGNDQQINTADSNSLKSKNQTSSEQGSILNSSNTRSMNNYLVTSNKMIFKNQTFIKLVGTKRYMAPELLTEMPDVVFINGSDIVLKSDVYAYGLVLWEITRRILINGSCLSAELPYYDVAPNDPSLDEIAEIILNKKIRPSIPNELKKNSKILMELYEILKECWYEKPDSRISMTYICKKLSEIEEKYK